MDEDRYSKMKALLERTLETFRYLQSVLPRPDQHGDVPTADTFKKAIKASGRAFAELKA